MNPSADNPLLADAGWVWHNRFASLGPAFFTRLPPSPLPAPYWVGISPSTAQLLGLKTDWLSSDAALHAFSGNIPLVGSAPLASVYSGHQFGHWAGQLGDGRAIWLGEVQTPTGPLELQLKGSGRTPYSRGGDGRAVLRSSIREFLCSEAMHALGIPTTRALCITGSPEPVYRETRETAAVVTRVAPSFIRFGHFEHFAARQQWPELRQLADFVIDHYYPNCRHNDRFNGNTYAALLHAVSQRSAQLVAQWQAIGFCHGVLNTDNMSILGLTLDYGPFQFLDAFDPGHICNHSDHHGRYAFHRQPEIVRWNLYRLGQALQPLIGEPTIAEAALEDYQQQFSDSFLQQMRAKLGLSTPCHQDTALVGNLLQWLALQRVDYPIFWHRLSVAVAEDHFTPVRELLLDPVDFDSWLPRYLARLGQESRGQVAATMQHTNPRFVLRNHLAEETIEAAKLGDFSVLQRLQTVLGSPFDAHPDHAAWADFPPAWASSISISCSS
ncbi:MULTISPECIES: protein adenylyltransferase SelO [Giesbergeria]|uniref:Protein nucleotidyltransferase YdiU n=1 Tax=Giesbergeria sinuosa TaxID=80883 RepID=A0ABV9QAP0_9BURK